jgi:hypothetical protein
MESKELDVRCPACRASLAVDVRTARVVRWSEQVDTDPLGRPKLTERDWDAALGRVRAREERAREMFDSVLEAERSRDRDLDERFDRLTAGSSGGAQGAGRPEFGARGRGLALALVELERSAEGDAAPWPTPAQPYVLDRADALAAGHGPVLLLADAERGEAAAQLEREGLRPVGHRTVWTRVVGARPRLDLSPATIRSDGRGLAQAPDLDESESEDRERLRVEAALVAAEGQQAWVLAVRARAFSRHEGWLTELGFVPSHTEWVWAQAGR